MHPHPSLSPGLSSLKGLPRLCPSDPVCPQGTCRVCAPSPPTTWAHPSPALYLVTDLGPLLPYFTRISKLPWGKVTVKVAQSDSL